MGTETNVDLANFADVLFTSATGIYALALVLMVIELATSRVDATAARDRKRELVAAGGGPIATDSTPGRVLDDGPRRTKSERIGRMGYALVVAGLLVHVTSIVLRGVATGRMPWGNMYEFMSIMCAGAVLASLVLLRKPEALKVDIDVRYVGFDVPNEFVIGYGLDYAEKYRNVPFVATLAQHVYS